MTAYKDAKHDSLSSIEATKSSVDMEHTLLQQMLENRLEADTTGSTQDSPPHFLEADSRIVG